MNQKQINKKFLGTKWSIEPSKKWILEISEGVYSFFDPEGYGALQISEYIQDSYITTSDIMSFIDNEDDISHATEVEYGDFTGFYLIYVDEDGILWRKWWLKSNSLLLFITYNCDFEKKDYELSEVDKSILSLKTMN
jgi:hypothetical protein